MHHIMRTTRLRQSTSSVNTEPWLKKAFWPPMPMPSSSAYHSCSATAAWAGKASTINWSPHFVAATKSPSLATRSALPSAPPSPHKASCSSPAVVSKTTSTSPKSNALVGLLHLGGRDQISLYELGLLTLSILGLNEQLAVPISVLDSYAGLLETPFLAARSANVTLDSALAYELGFDPPPLRDPARGTPASRLAYNLPVPNTAPIADFGIRTNPIRALDWTPPAAPASFSRTFSPFSLQSDTTVVAPADESAARIVNQF